MSSAQNPLRDKPKPSAMYRSQEEPVPLLIAKGERTWMSTAAEPDREAEVFLLLGCGVRPLPHLMLDSVAVLKALGIDFVAGAGQPYCCGNPYRPDQLDAADRMAAASMDRMTSWGSRTIAHWCTACMLTFGAWSRGDQMLWTGGGDVPLKARKAPQDAVENLHIHTLVERRLRELGDRVPWKKELSARVLVEGHPELTQVHDVARTDAARILEMVPGVEVLGYVDSPPTFKQNVRSNCNSAFRDLTEADVRRIRVELGAQARERGADTVSCQHHNCHRTWSRFASEGLAVKQPLSLVAEALGIENPDRFQAFAHLADADSIVDHAEPIWRSWDLDRDEAKRIAREVFDLKYADKPACACGGDLSKCEEEPIIQVAPLVRS